MNKKEINIKDLALYLIDKKKIKSPLLLQKILFLIRYEELSNKQDFGIFKEKDDFQAWINGPVQRKIYDDFKLYFYDEEEADLFKLNDLEKEEFIKNSYEEYIDKYMKIYDKNNVWALVNLTHENQAWINARKDLNDDEPSINQLKNEEIPQVTNRFKIILNKLI